MHLLPPMGVRRAGQTNRDKNAPALTVQWPNAVTPCKARQVCSPSIRDRSQIIKLTNFSFIFVQNEITQNSDLLMF